MEKKQRKGITGSGKRKIQVAGILILAGGILTAVSFVLLTILDVKSLQKLASETLFFASRHVTYYQEEVVARQTESLLSLKDKAQGMRKLLDEKAEEFSKELVMEFLEDQKVSGVLILDENLETEAAYDLEREDILEWRNAVSAKDLEEIIGFPQKKYMISEEINGEVYDFAAVSRVDREGIVLLYHRKNASIVKSQDAELAELFSEYAYQKGGTILLLGDGDPESLSKGGNTIVWSTDGEWEDASALSQNTAETDGISEVDGTGAFESTEKLEGLDNFFDLAELEGLEGLENFGGYEEIPTIFVYDMQENYHGLLRAQYGKEIWYGLADRVRGSTICAFFPEREVFRQRGNILFVIVAVYLIFCLLFCLYLYRMEEKNQLTAKALLEESVEDARRANVAKTDFLRRMSHDIRTPINGIRGMVEIADHFPEDFKKQKECREKIWEVSGFLLDLVNNVLDMNKLESGELIMEETPFSLKDVSAEVAAVIRPQTDAHGLTLKTGQMDITHYQVIGCQLYLRQILLNLAGNAVKYNRPGGSIEVGCKETESTDGQAWFIFTVADTGLGMSEQFQKHMFEPFSQENVQERSTYTGTGLGLPITKELTEKMGGSISCVSRQNEGTVFTVRLPFRIDESKEQEAELKSEDTEGLKGCKVLLAEDNQLNQEIAAFFLKEAGMEVVTADNGQEAVECFAGEKPGTFDFILMDVMMPVMDGLEATRQIRAMDREDAKTVAIFAMTANAFADDIRQSREAGMNEHLAKPLDSQTLLKKLCQYQKNCPRA